MAGHGAFNTNRKVFSETMCQNLEGQCCAVLLGAKCQLTSHATVHASACSNDAPCAAVFQFPNAPVTVLQLRAPTVSGCEEGFAIELAAWVKSAGFAEVVILAGADAAQRADRQMTGCERLPCPLSTAQFEALVRLCAGRYQVRVVGNSAPHVLLPKALSLGFAELELPVRTAPHLTLRRCAVLAVHV